MVATTAGAGTVRRAGWSGFSTERIRAAVEDAVREDRSVVSAHCEWPYHVDEDVMNVVAAILIPREACVGFFAPRSFDVSLEDQQVGGLASDINVLRRSAPHLARKEASLPGTCADGHYLLSTPSPPRGSFA
jgi:hypothetical protein